MKIKVKYFASFRELSKKEEEIVNVEKPIKLKSLYERLQKKYKFSLDFKDIRVAVNEGYPQETIILKSDDVIVFIPPIAGG